MRTSRYLATVAVAALVSVLVPLSPANADPGAAATNVLTHTSPAPAGPAVPVGATLASGLKTGTTAKFMSSSGGSTGITCTASNFVGTVSSNPVPPPGTAAGTVGTHNFSGCTENILGVNSVQSITVNNLSFDVNFNSATKAITITDPTAIQTTVVLNTVLGQITCVYRAVGNTVTGTASNTDNSMNFVNQQFTKASGPFTCFSNAFWTTTYAPVRVTSVAGSPLVFVN